MQETLFYGAALGLLTAFVYAAVGKRVGSRDLAGEARLANRMFSAWWWSLGGITAVSAVVSLAAGVGLTNLSVHVALTVILILVLCFSLWALGYYLIYLFTGKRAILVPLAVFYAFYFAFIMYLVWQAHPVAVAVDQWSATLEYQRPLLTGDANLWLLILLIAPQVVGGIAYFSLFFRVDERSQKYRIAMVAGTIVVWFGSSIVASAAGWNELMAWPIVSRLIGLTAAIVIYAAFRPPRWMQRRYGLEPVSMVVTTPVHRATHGDQFQRPARVPYSAPPLPST